MVQNSFRMVTLVALATLLIVVTSEEVMMSQSFIGNDFNDADGWAVSNAPSGFNVCSGVKIFGGDNKFGTRATIVKAFELPPHHSLRVKVQMWKIDSWDNEWFVIYVDDAQIHKQQFIYHKGKPLCGRGHAQWNEEVTNMNVLIKHTGATAVVVFSSTLDQAANDESWGIRDFQLFIDKCPEGCSTCTQGEGKDACQVWEATKGFWTGLKKEKISSEGWTVTGGIAEPYVCAGVPVFGGFKNMGKGTIVKNTVQLPPHYRLKIKLVVLKIDSWDNEFAQFKIDGKEVWLKRYQWHEGYMGQICGSGTKDWREVFTRIEIEAQHTGDQATFELLNSLNEAPTNESIGFRDFYIFIAKCAKNCDECTGPKPADCKKCQNDWALQDGECKPLANFILLEQSFQENKFTGINGWTLQANKAGQLISECGGKSLVGGYNIFGVKGVAQKSFTIPNHTRLRLMTSIYKIDSWDNEWMFIKIDGVDVWKKQWNLQTGGGSFCGLGNWNDHIETVDIIFVHKADKATVLFTSTLNQDAADESWGFRDFKLFYESKEECAIFYSECDFKGASFEFCAKSPDFKKDSIPPKIRSIRVPPQGQVTLFESTDYNGKKVTYTEDQKCIKSFNFSLLQVEPGSSNWSEIQME